MESPSVQRIVLKHFWWHWMLVNLLGISLALLLWYVIPIDIRSPPTWEDDPIAAPWRYIILYGVSYAVISTAQWVVLRRHVSAAWWWIIGTTGFAALIYPSTIWAFDTLGYRTIAERVMTVELYPPAGLGGHVFALLGQTLVLLRWTRYGWLWLLLAPFMAVAAIGGVWLTTIGLEQRLSINGVFYVRVLLTIVFFSALQGVLLSVLLRKRRHAVSTGGSQPSPTATSS